MDKEFEVLVVAREGYYYKVVADNEEEAKKIAMEKYNDGIDPEDFKELMEEGPTII